MKTDLIDKIALALVVIGGLNWGLVGLMNFNLVTSLFGSIMYLDTIVYSLVGLSALWVAYYLSQMMK